MKEPGERDHGLLGLVERLMRRQEEPAPAKPAPDPVVRDGLDPPVTEAAVPASLEPLVSVEGTRTLSHAEMADTILRALKAIDGCPSRGFEITVYGSSPWNAMLRITPAAGPSIDAAAWRTRVRDMVPLLRDQYEVVE